MLHLLSITTGDDYQPISATKAGRLVECRVEMELSKPARFALRFEEELCEQAHELLDGGSPLMRRDTRIGLFTMTGPKAEKLACVLVGRVIRIRSSHVVGGRGSWVEVHGEDRRIDMNKVAIQEVYAGRASETVQKILGAYGFETVEVQQTVQEYKKPQPQLTQTATDLAFVEDLARQNNMDFWIAYTVNGSVASVAETARFRTSPDRKDAPAPPLPPVLSAPDDRTLRLHPAGADCANITKFDARIDYDKPTSAFGFAMDEHKEREVRGQLADQLTPADPAKVANTRKAIGERKTQAPPAADPIAAQLIKEGLVQEQSWFVEADCSASTDQLGFLVVPHMLVKVANMGPNLTGSYQVKSATHVFTATDRLVDFTLRANGFEEASGG